MKNTVNASAKDVEKFVRAYELHSTMKKMTVGNITHFQFFDTLEDGGKKTSVWWANISLIEKEEGTQVIRELLVDSIYRSFKDGERRAEAIDGYRQKLNTIHADILEHFKEKAKPEELTITDGAIVRYGTDKDLSLSGVKQIVKRCKAVVANGGKITEFWKEDNKGKYRLGTLRKWLDDPKFID